MIDFHLMIDERMYIADLCQDGNAARFVRFREPNDLRHPDCALSTKSYSGLTLKAYFGDSVGDDVVIEDGQDFAIIDGHSTWMTKEEEEYFEKYGVLALEKPGRPWVTEVPPELPPM